MNISFSISLISYCLQVTLLRDCGLCSVNYAEPYSSAGHLSAINIHFQLPLPAVIARSQRPASLIHLHPGQSLPNPPHLAALAIFSGYETNFCSQLQLRTGNMVFGLSRQAKLMRQTKAANAIINILVSCISRFALRVLRSLSHSLQLPPSPSLRCSVSVLQPRKYSGAAYIHRSSSV